jgi:ABC-type multidrug transport system fused ATPase/permease subunit
MTTLKLLGVAVLCGAFTGLRGGLFSLAMWRLNVRIRQELFKSLLAQEVGFYDTAQTGAGLWDVGVLGFVGEELVWGAPAWESLSLRTITEAQHKLPCLSVVMAAGEISSRLSADTTTVSDAISLNLNVLVRSATQVRVFVTVGLGFSILPLQPLNRIQHSTPPNTRTFVVQRRGCYMQPICCVNLLGRHSQGT